MLAIKILSSKEGTNRIPIQFLIILFIAFLALTSILTFNKKIDVTDGDIGFRTVSFI